MKEVNFISHEPLRYEEEDMKSRAKNFYELMDRRRSYRQFSPDNFPVQIIEEAIKTAGTAPSGAHKQPWTFCIVSNPEIKSKIREAAEKEEYLNYHGRMGEQWLKDLEPFGTNHDKPFLETAPYLIVVFKRIYELDGDERISNYYVNESVGIATGFLLAALHHSGLVALTHTPSPMNFLAKVLNRPENERAFLLIPVGLPPSAPIVPDIERKPLDRLVVYYN